MYGMRQVSVVTRMHKDPEQVDRPMILSNFTESMASHVCKDLRQRDCRNDFAQGGHPGRVSRAQPESAVVGAVVYAAVALPCAPRGLGK
eukprot:6371683-Amphidinium_carterae.1